MPGAPVAACWGCPPPPKLMTMFCPVSPGNCIGDIPCVLAACALMACWCIPPASRCPELTPGAPPVPKRCGAPTPTSLCAVRPIGPTC